MFAVREGCICCTDEAQRCEMLRHFKFGFLLGLVALTVIVPARCLLKNRRSQC
jgi:hypothetical protein